MHYHRMVVVSVVVIVRVMVDKDDWNIVVVGVVETAVASIVVVVG